MAREILQVNDVAALLARRGQGRDAERVNGHVRVELQTTNVAFDKLLHGPAAHQSRGKAVPAFATGGPGRPEQSAGRIAVDASYVQPSFEPLGGFGVQRDEPF